MFFRKKIGKKKVIYIVVDSTGWIQHQRVEVLKKQQDQFEISMLTAKKFKFFWKLGFLRKRYIYFSSWRIAHLLTKDHHDFFKPQDYNYFMAAVTSHSNIGGGLHPEITTGFTPTEEAFRKAVDHLKRYKVVTANSSILYDLLEKEIPQLLYTPNGVDADFYCPDSTQRKPHSPLRVGSVGKERSAKNLETLREVAQKLDPIHFDLRLLTVAKDSGKGPMNLEEMKNFYQSLDFYLCASWNEGTPNPALEAASCGVPVISTEVGNMPELILHGENGFFVDPSVDSILVRLKQLKNLPASSYETLSRNARKSIQDNWTWKDRMIAFTAALSRLSSEQTNPTSLQVSVDA